MHILFYEYVYNNVYINNQQLLILTNKMQTKKQNFPPNPQLQTYLPTSTTDYNATLNKIYFNPYRLQNHSLLSLTHSQIYNMHKSFISNKKSCILEDNDQSNLLSEDYDNVNSSGQGFGIGEGRKIQGLKAARLASSQIFQCEGFFANNQCQQKIAQKPVINYFVTQFQRLQQQNKRLSKKLQQYQQRVQNSDSTETSKSQLDLLFENKQLKKQLEKQRKASQQKNEKINQLVFKITEIQGHIDFIVKNCKVEQEKQGYESQICMDVKSKPRRSFKGKCQNCATLEQQKKMLSQQIEEIKIHYSSVINQSVNKLLEKIGFLESQLNQQSNINKNLQEKVENLNTSLRFS